MRDSEQILTGLVPMSARLEAIVELAEKGDTVCDVGCDHAHVPIRLLQTGCYRRAIGMDVIAGPLGKAAGNLALYGMEDKVELRLSDGLDSFSPGEAETLVITGMGGTLMEEILLRSPSVTGSFSVLVLGPQSDPEKVRAALRTLGFTIKKEKIIFEDGKYYPVIRAESRDMSRQCGEQERVSAEAASPPGGQELSPETMQEAEDRFGPVLLGHRDPVLFEFLKRRKAALEKILRSIGQAVENTDSDPALLEKHSARQREIEHDLTVFKAALSLYSR